MKRRVAFLLVWLVAGCATGGKAAPTTSTSASPVSSLPQGSAVPSTRPQATTVPPGTLSEPTFPSPSGEVMVQGEGFPAVLVAGPDGVLVIAENGEPDLLVDGPADNAAEDTMGGVLFQRSTVEAELSVVWWNPAGSAAPQQLLVPSSGQSLVLSGVAESEAGVDIWYTRRVGDSPEDMSQTLRRYSLTTGTVTEVAEVGGWEASMRVSVTPSLLVGEWAGEAWHGFRFFEPDWNEVEVEANPYGPEGVLDCGPCPSTVTVSDDGSRLAWLEGGQFFSQELVVTETFTGTELRRVSIPDGLGILGPLDLHNDTVVVNRQDNDGAWLAALVIDMSGSQPTVVSLPTAGQARLLRAELAVGDGPPSP